MKAVSDALDELHHQFQMAHLDVRLPNICFTSSENLEVNLDRWEPVFRRYGNTALRRFVASVMHQARKDWTVDRVDWRQLGIMVHAFLNNITGHAYHTQPPPCQEQVPQRAGE